MCRITIFLLLVATQLVTVLATYLDECEVNLSGWLKYSPNPPYSIATSIECGNNLTGEYHTAEGFMTELPGDTRIELYVICMDIHGSVRTKNKLSNLQPIQSTFSWSDPFSEPGATCVVIGCFQYDYVDDGVFYSVENSSCTFDQPTELPPPEVTTIEMTVTEPSSDIITTTDDKSISSDVLRVQSATTVQPATTVATQTVATQETVNNEESIAPSGIPATTSQTRMTTVINSTPIDKVSPSSVSTQETETLNMPEVTITPSTVTDIPITTSQTMPTMMIISTPTDQEQTPTTPVSTLVIIVVMILLLLSLVLLMAIMSFILVKAHQRYRLKHSRIYYTDCSEPIDPYFNPIDINAQVKTAVSVVSIFDVYNPYLPIDKENDTVNKETFNDDEKSVILQAINPIEDNSSAKSMVFEGEQAAITIEDSIDGDINSEKYESDSALSMDEYGYDSPSELQCEEMEEENDLASSNVPLNIDKRDRIVSSGYVSSLDDATHQPFSSQNKEGISPRNGLSIASGYADGRNLTSYNVSISEENVSEQLGSSFSNSSYVRVSDVRLITCSRPRPSNLARNCRDDLPLSLDTKCHKFHTQLSSSSGYITETNVSTPSSISESLFSARLVSTDHDAQTVPAQTVETGQSYQTIDHNMQLFERGYTMASLPHPVKHSLPVEDIILFTEDDEESIGAFENDPIENDHYHDKRDGLEPAELSDKLFSDSLLAECSLSLNPLHFEPIEFENGYELDHVSPPTTPRSDSDVADDSELNVYKWIPSLLTSSEAH